MSGPLEVQPDEYYVEGGFGTDDQLHFGVYWDQSATAMHIGAMRTVGNQLSILDRFGAVLHSTQFNAFMAVNGLPGGSLLDALLPPGGNGGGGSNPCLVDPTACGQQPQVAPNEQRSSISENGSERLVTTVHRGSTTAMGMQSGGATTTVTRRYRRFDSRWGASRDTLWRLVEVRSSEQGPATALASSFVQVTRIEYLRFNVNTAKDQQRAGRRLDASADSRTRAAELESVQPLPHTVAANTVSVAASAGGVCGNEGVNIDTVVAASGVNLIWQHGICSGASTWDGMRPMISSQLPVARELAFSLTPLDAIGSQAAVLQGAVSNLTGATYIVGHSQGGLIARRAAQLSGTAIAGVVTIASPHEGAKIAEVPAEVLQSLLASKIGGECFGSVLCSVRDAAIAAAVSNVITYGVAGALAPVVNDLVPGASFLSTLNSTPEPFQRASIQVEVPPRWSLFRVVGDATTARTALFTNQRPNGAQLTANVETVYRSALFLRALSTWVRYMAPAFSGGVSCGYSGYSTHWTACSDPGSLSYWDSWSFWDHVASLLYFVGNFVVTKLDVVDAFWNDLVGGTEIASDGFLQYSTQRYPAVPGTFAPIRLSIQGELADSHTGETASPQVLVRLSQVLLDLGVVP